MHTRSAPGLGPLPIMIGAIAWSWAWWLAAIAFGGVETAAGGSTWLVGGLGPAVAVVIAYRRSGSDYRRSFRRRLVQWRIPWPWLLAAVALTVGPKSIALLLAALGGHTATGESIALAEVPISLVFFIIVVWIEEPLWRGVALDGFRDSLVRASLVIGAFWSIWHMPLFLVEGTWQHGLGFGTLDFWVFSIAIFGLSVFLTWLVAGSGGSILLAMAGHLLINATGEFLPDDTTVRVIEMLLIMLVAAGLLYRLRLRVNEPAAAIARRAAPGEAR